MFAIHTANFNVPTSASGSGILTDIMRVGTVHVPDYFVGEWIVPSPTVTHAAASLNNGIGISIVVENSGYRVTVSKTGQSPFNFYSKAQYILTLLY